MTRRKAREEALCIIYEKSFHEGPLPERIKLALEARDFKPAPFALELAGGVCANLDEIDGKIEKYSIKWSKKRISRIALSVLRISIYEILYEDSIPDSVSINEAVELAKKYGGEGDSTFINGLLGAFVRGRGGEKGKPGTQDSKPGKADT